MPRLHSVQRDARAPAEGVGRGAWGWGLVAGGGGWWRLCGGLCGVLLVESGADRASTRHAHGSKGEQGSRLGGGQANEEGCNLTSSPAHQLTSSPAAASAAAAAAVQLWPPCPRV